MHGFWIENVLIKVYVVVALRNKHFKMLLSLEISKTKVYKNYKSQQKIKNNPKTNNPQNQIIKNPIKVFLI